MKMKCPRCGKEIEYSTDNPYRPFCCKRCKDADLYGWLEDDDEDKDKSSSDSGDTNGYNNLH